MKKSFVFLFISLFLFSLCDTACGQEDTKKKKSESKTAETAKSAESAETAAQAENAAAAETAKNADFATRAGQVDNLAGNYADLVFSYSTQGTLLVRTTRDSQWTKLTGSVV